MTARGRRAASLAFAFASALACPLGAFDPPLASAAAAAATATGTTSATIAADARTRGPTLADCDARVAAEPSSFAAYRCYWFVARNRVAWEDACRRLEALLRRDPRNVHAKLFLGTIAVDRGEARAAGLLREAAAEYARRGALEEEVHARTTLGVFERRKGHIEAAAAELERALARATASGRADLVAEVQIQLGWQAYSARDYGAALHAFEKAEAAVFPAGSIFHRLETVDGLAAAAWALGRSEQALACYARELDLLSGSDPYRAAYVRRNALFVLRALVDAGEREPEELVAAARDALDAAQRAGNRLSETGARLMLAERLPAADAQAQARAALALARATSHPADTIWALRVLGERAAEEGPGPHDEALASLAEAIALADDHGDAESRAAARAGLARALWRGPDRERALDATVAALDAAERLRDLQPERETRARVFGRFADLHREAVDQLLSTAGPAPAEDDVARAFAIAERMRARALLDTLDAAGAASPDGPAAALARRRPVLPSLDAVRAGIGPGQAMLAFVVPRAADAHAARGWVFALTRERATALPIDDPARVERESRLFVALLARGDGSERAGAERLFAHLLQPALDTLPASVERLVIVPDGALHGVPFDALRAGPGAPYLAERYVTSLAPSAAVWLRMTQSAPSPHPVPLLSLADPVVRGTPDGAAPGGALPHARREARRFARAFGADSRVLAGAAASERALKTADLARYALLHFAAHGVVDGAHPERSAVLLAADGGEDGVLQYREIVDLPLQGPTVVLSTCLSATGPVLGGEGAMALSAAFLHAGARAVIASPWPLPDAEAAAFMDSFGRGLARGESTGRALAGARRDAIRRGVPLATWAAFAVFGDGDAVPHPRGHDRAQRALAVGAMLAVALSAGLLVLRRRRRRA